MTFSGFRRGLFRVVLAAGLLGGSAFAGEEQRPDDLVPLLVPDGGMMKQEGDRLDIFTRDGKRDAYGIRRGDGSIDLFNRDSTRRATITPGIAGQPPRVTVPKGKR